MSGIIIKGNGTKPRQPSLLEGHFLRQRAKQAAASRGPTPSLGVTATREPDRVTDRGRPAPRRHVWVFSSWLAGSAETLTVLMGPNML